MRVFDLATIVGLGLVVLCVFVLRASQSKGARSATQPAGRSPVGDASREMRVYSKSGYDITPLPRSRIEALAENLAPEERRVLLGKATERPFCGTLLNNDETGSYTCRLCGLPLFSSHAKFKSGTGWPSFSGYQCSCTLRYHNSNK